MEVNRPGERRKTWWLVERAYVRADFEADEMGQCTTGRPSIAGRPAGLPSLTSSSSHTTRSGLTCSQGEIDALQANSDRVGGRLSDPAARSGRGRIVLTVGLVTSGGCASSACILLG